MGIQYLESGAAFRFLFGLLIYEVCKKRGFLQKELKFALEIWKEKLEDDIYLIPVRFDDCDVPSYRDYAKGNLKTIVEQVLGRMLSTTQELLGTVDAVGIKRSTGDGLGVELSDK